jgi:nitrate/nitrite transport system permease protein
VAWMVIVAGEMLSGGTGIGFFVWDSWNALNLDRVISAILIIGIVGLVLDRAFEALQRRVTHAG